MPKRVAVDCRLDAPPGSRKTVVVAIDVLRATTTAVTAVAAGRRCFPADSAETARDLAGRFPGALLVGEQAGAMPDGFDLNNSPAAVAARGDVERPMVLLSTSGARLIRAAGRTNPVQVGSLRNLTAQAAQLLPHDDVALVGAPTDGEFREEDQICCARLAELLMDAGFEPDAAAREIADRWRAAPPEALLEGRSADYLRRTGQEDDLRFVLEHVDDLDATFALQGEEVVAAPRTVAPHGGPQQA
ncbi:MAG: 2-phosphosulfolactate phosphatase [Actinomycetota bacterium]